MNVLIVERELQSVLHLLQPEQKLQVLNFIKNLITTQLRGVAGTSLLRFAGMIEEDDLTIMAQAIAEEPESVRQRSEH